MKSFKNYLKENSEEHWLGTSNPERLYKDHSDDQMHSSGAYNKLREDKSKLHNRVELTKGETNSIDHYTGSLHKNLNRYHRGQPLKEYGEGDSERDFWHIPEYLNMKTERLDSAIGKHTTEHPSHVWRGVSADVMDKLKPGDTFHDKGYVSTSMRPRTAEGFTKGTGPEHRIRHMMHIKLPVGTKAISPDNYPETSPMMEHEVILPRNSKFRYEGSSIHQAPDSSNGYKGNIYHVHHLTHIPEGSE